jgi:hypothetical protein
MAMGRADLPAFAPGGWFCLHGGAQGEAEPLGGAGSEGGAGDEAEAKRAEGRRRADDAEAAVIREVDVDDGIPGTWNVLEGALGGCGDDESCRYEFRAGGAVGDGIAF